MSDTDDLIKDFLVESYENLDQLDRDFVELEKQPTDRSTLSSVFRTIHTIKGTCGFLGFHKLESVTHVGENLLSKLRDGVILLDSDITSAMLKMVDAVRQILNHIETTGNEGDADYTELVNLLTRLNDRSKSPAETAESAAADAAIVAAALDAQAPLAVSAVCGATVASQVVASPAQVPAFPAAVTAPVEPAPAVDGEAPELHPAAVAEAPLGAIERTEGKSAVADSSIRVDVRLLDKLMNLVGELVLARNQILQHTAHLENATLTGTTQRLNLITTELQAGVMKTRMQPINIIWQKLPRVVRDLSQQLGKRIRLDMEGRETELDKTIVEAIKDPLTHVVRNSVDHGVETPEQRAAKGKPAEGRLLLRAFHEGGQVIIEITDDGGGINVERVKAKAVSNGLITAEHATRMGDREAMHLIFLPGFSTAEKVTNVSGRGVGMDVVKTNIERIGGSVDVQSVGGQGTTLRIKIPLTLAIIPALLVTSGGQRFAIPQVSLLELVRLEASEGSSIESIHGAPVYRLRGNLLPLVYLNRTLALDASDSSILRQNESEATNIVVLQADGRQFGLVVDQINDTEEIVVKPLGKQLKGMSLFAGATIMGDGRVALILDVMGIAQKSNVVSGSRDRTGGAEATSSRQSSQDKQTLLVCHVGRNRRMAIRLSEVSRLEEFAIDSLETSGGSSVVQYRGQIMPLVRLSEVYGEGAVESGETHIHAVVFNRKGRSIGMIVERILDIVDEQLIIQSGSGGAGVTGSAILQGKVTEVIDIDGVLRLALDDSATEQGALLAA